MNLSVFSLDVIQVNSAQFKILVLVLGENPTGLSFPAFYCFYHVSVVSFEKRPFKQICNRAIKTSKFG